MAQESITLDQMIDRLTERVGNNTTYWVEAEKIDAINEAICVWQCLTGEWNERVQIPVVSGQIFYQTPSQLTGIQRIKWYPAQNADRLSQAVLLVGSSLPELDLAFFGWEGTTGTPSLWTSNGINEFALYPQPLVGTLQIEAIKDAPRVAMGDFVDIPADLVTPLLAYGHYYLTQKEGGAEMQGALDGLKEFIEAAADRNSELSKTSFYLRFMGLPKEEGLRPARSPNQSVGAR